MLETETEASAMAWLRPEADACWSWDPTCEVILWHDGSTLLFREELGQIIERLLPAKVPNAGLIFLLLAAVKGKLPTSPGHPESQDCFARLSTLAQLPQELLSGVRAKTHLIEYFTEGLSCLTPAKATAVLHVLREGLPLLPLSLNASGPPLLAVHLRQLEPTLRGMEVETLRHRLETGMDIAPKPAELESTAAQVIQLLQELRQDSEFAGLAQLVMDLTAALSLPRALASPDLSAPMGLSDISNRGPIHRLLTSELAHDDDMLAMRLALNEALYLKNEPPASTPLAELVLLIDSGIRLWGTPRIFATACALALLAKSPKQQVACTFRAQLTGAAPIELTRKPGLTRHLAALELNEHPGVALKYLIPPADDCHPIDLAVITHENALEDSSFCLPTDLPENAHVYLIAINREGDVSMFLATKQGHRLLKQAKLDLSHLLPGKARTVLDPHARFPAIFSRDPFPFLLVPPDLLAPLNLATKDYCAGVNQTGTIWYWKSTKQGARQIPAPPLPGTPILFAHDGTAHCLVLLKYTSEKLHLLIQSDDPFAGPGVRIIDNAPGKPKSTFRRNGLLYVLYEQLVDVIDLTTGQTVVRAPLPGALEQIGDGFYRKFPKEIGSLGWNGRELAWESLRIIPTHNDILAVFQRKGLEGPWLLDTVGNIKQTCKPYKYHKISFPEGAVPEVSPDGHEIRMTFPDGKSKVFKIKDGQTELGPYRPTGIWPKRIAAPHWSIRTNFTHIACQPVGHLVLRSGKGRWVRIQLNDRGTSLMFVPLDEQQVEVFERVAFKAIPSPPETDYTLMEATWPSSGSRAILDSRGMLHLQSGRIQIPEVTLVLAESNSLPAWSSNGTIIGPSFFLGRKGSNGEAKQIDGIIRAFIEAIR